MGSRARITLATLLLAVLASGCGEKDGQRLDRWTLHVPGRAPRDVHVPVHLDDDLPKEIVRYRLVTDAELVPDLVGRDVDLIIASLPAAIRLFVNGHEARAVHDARAPPPYRHTGPHRWFLPDEETSSGRVRLELEIAHRWTQSAWIDVAPELIPAGATTRVLESNRWRNDRGGWFGLIALSQIGFTFLVVFLWDRRRKAYLWFAIQALTASFYPAYVLGLPMLFLPPAAENIVLAQTLTVGSLVSIWFTHDFFGLDRPHRGWLVLMALGVLLPLPAAIPSFLDTSYAAPVVVLCVVSAIGYQMVIGARLVRSYTDRNEAIFFLGCWIALGGSAWIDLFAWVGGGEVLEGGRPACVGLGLFGIFQSMLLARSHFRTMSEADRLNEALRGRLHELEGRQQEIEGLNEELRQQIGRRTSTLLAAFTGSERLAGPVELRPDDDVDGRYRVVRALGAGGMGTVYEVVRIHDGNHFALKIAQDVRGLALARLAREAQIATKIRHPNVVGIVDADVSQAGYMYLVMELVPGCTLAEYEGPKDDLFCLEVLIQILDGVRALHERGIVHRDLKPANVLLSGDLEKAPVVKITDFGISRWLDQPPAEGAPAIPPPTELPTVRISSSRPPPPESKHTSVLPGRGRRSSSESLPAFDGRSPSEEIVEPADSRQPTISSTIRDSSPGDSNRSNSSSQLTQAGSIAGTPSYIAPEMAEPNATLGPPVDVFSFGVVAYRLLTDQHPYEEAPLLARLAGRDVPPPKSLAIHRPSLPEAAMRALDACLSPDPAKRPSTDDLRHVLGDALEHTKKPRPSKRPPTASSPPSR